MKLAARMLALITSAYRKTDEYNVANNLPLVSNIGRIFAVFGWGLNIIEENAERVRLWANIDNARGAVLDRYGANFGVKRGGAPDVFYRLMIKIKILSQLSGGDMETIYWAVSGLYEIDPATIEIDEIFPAKLQIMIREEDLPLEYDGIKDLVGALTKRLLAAGVGLDMLYLTEDTMEGQLYIGGRPVSEFTRIRLANHTTSLPAELNGSLYLGGYISMRFSRERLKSHTTLPPSEINGLLHLRGRVAAQAGRIRLQTH